MKAKLRMFTRVHCLTAASFAAAAFALGGAMLQEFEVASVKSAAAPDQRKGHIHGGPGTDDPVRITITNYSLKVLLQKVYRLETYQYKGPEWMASEKYDIVANVPLGATAADVDTMLQNLLIQRFQLKLHHEPTRMTTYNLVLSKSGPKLTPSADTTAGSPGVRPVLGPKGPDGFPQLNIEYVKSVGASTLVLSGTAKTVASGESMDSFAKHLTIKLGHPVFDKTGLTGKYDFSFLWAALDVESDTSDRSNDGQVSGAPSIFVAIEKALGLNLKLQNTAVDVLVIDHGEKKPLEN